jgi:hypothetical protein
MLEFDRLRLELFARGFPQPDITTGLYDLKAIEAWQDARSGLTPDASALTEAAPLRNASEGFADRVARLANGHR